MKTSDQIVDKILKKYKVISPLEKLTFKAMFIDGLDMVQKWKYLSYNNQRPTPNHPSAQFTENYIIRTDQFDYDVIAYYDTYNEKWHLYPEHPNDIPLTNEQVTAYRPIFTE